MQRVAIHELERRLSELVARAESGESLLITRHGRVVAQLVPPTPHLHVGSRVGSGELKALFQRPATGGLYLDVLADDRHGGGGEPF